MRFDGGWIKLHRKITTSWLTNDPNAFCMWITLLLWANRKESRIRGEIIQRGEILTSISELARIVGGHRSTAYRTLSRLAAEQMVTQRRNRRGTILTIVNFDKYQGSDDECETQAEHFVEQQRNSSGTAAEQQRTRIGELENSRRGEGEKEYICHPESGGSRAHVSLDIISPDGDDTPIPKKTKKVVAIEDPEIIAVADAWFQYAKQQQPWRPDRGEWCVQGFARSLAKLARATNLNASGLQGVLKFVKDDDFWHKNAISPNGLLTLSKNGSRKIDNILNKMQPKRDRELDVMKAWVADETPTPIHPF